MRVEYLESPLKHHNTVYNRILAKHWFFNVSKVIWKHLMGKNWVMIFSILFYYVLFHILFLGSFIRWCAVCVALAENCVQVSNTNNSPLTEKQKFHPTTFQNLNFVKSVDRPPSCCSYHENENIFQSFFFVSNNSFCYFNKLSKVFRA